MASSPSPPSDGDPPRPPTPTIAPPLPYPKQASRGNVLAIFAGLVSSSVVLVAALISISLVHRNALHEFTHECRENLVRLAEAAAAVVDGQLHQQITDRSQQNGPTFQAAVAPLRAMLGRVHGVKYIYTAIQRDQRIYFVLDSAQPGDADGDGRDDQAKIMEEYTDTDPAMLRCFTTGQSEAAAEPYQDAWGVFMTGFAWFYDREGHPVGIVGVDVSAEVYNARIASITRASWLATPPAFLIAFATGLGVFAAFRAHLTAQRYRTEKEAELRAYAEQLLVAAQESEEARQRAEIANQTKNQFLANMSHELRTPLTAIIGFADLLTPPDQLPSPSPPAVPPATPLDAATMVNTIRRNAKHLLDIINDVLDLAKIEANRLTVHTQTVPIAELIREAVDSLRHQAHAKGLSLDISWESLIPETILSDPLRLRQILLNLMGNAIKFTAEGMVKVRVRVTPTTEAPQTLEIAICDTGVGIAPETLSELFQPFVQADNSMTRQFGGTGLGLAISQRLAHQLGSRITVESTCGVGSTFTLHCPVPEQGLTWVSGQGATVTPTPAACDLPGPKATPSALPLAGCRMLLAEDGPDNQRLISILLRKAGAVVEVVENGYLAVCALTAGHDLESDLQVPPPFDLVVLDMQMPIMDGYTAARTLRDKGLPLPIIALTAHAMDHDRQKCLDAGCDDFATKPVSRDSLIQVMASWRDRQLQHSS